MERDPGRRNQGAVTENVFPQLGCHLAKDFWGQSPLTRRLTRKAAKHGRARLRR